MKTYLSLSLLSLGSVFLLGCTTGGSYSAPETPRTTFSESGIPPIHYLVGGGWDIDYAVPGGGTAYWVEETTARIIEMKSLNEGDRFQVRIAGPQDFEAALGVPMDEMRFTLYFVPVSYERVPLLSDIPVIGRHFSAEGATLGDRSESEQR